LGHARARKEGQTFVVLVHIMLRDLLVNPKVRAKKRLLILPFGYPRHIMLRDVPQSMLIPKN
jgi:hypothetical protein